MANPCSDGRSDTRVTSIPRSPPGGLLRSAGFDGGSGSSGSTSSFPATSAAASRPPGFWLQGRRSSPARVCGSSTSGTGTGGPRALAVGAIPADLIDGCGTRGRSGRPGERASVSCGPGSGASSTSKSGGILVERSPSSPTPGQSGRSWHRTLRASGARAFLRRRSSSATGDGQGGAAVNRTANSMSADATGPKGRECEAPAAARL
jgi:hypothetical protein